jgi:hypothetical protein
MAGQPLDDVEVRLAFGAIVLALSKLQSNQLSILGLVAALGVENPPPGFSEKLHEAFEEWQAARKAIDDAGHRIFERKNAE